MKQTILIFTGTAIAILLAFEISKYSMYAQVANKEFLVFISAVLFMMIGVFLQRFFNKNKHAQKKLIAPQEAIKKSGLSKQEHTVLTLVSEGLSNQEIAECLFIQESTVKSHVSSILQKLNAKRRTEAVKIGQDMQII